MTELGPRFVKAYLVGCIVPSGRCPAGAALVEAPRWGTLTIPQTPPQVRWPDCAGAVAHASTTQNMWGRPPVAVRGPAFDPPRA
jgi:hypothetical protein